MKTSRKRIKWQAEDYGRYAKKLKQSHLIVLDLRKSFTKQQKSAIRKTYNKFSNVINNPDKFVKRKVADKTLKYFKAFKYITDKNNHVYISKNKNYKIQVTSKSGYPAVKKFYKMTNGGEKITWDLLAPISKFPVDKFVGNFEVTAKFGANDTFGRSFENVNHFKNYIAELKRGGADLKFASISLIEYKVKISKKKASKIATGSSKNVKIKRKKSKKVKKTKK